MKQLMLVLDQPPTPPPSLEDTLNAIVNECAAYLKRGVGAGWADWYVHDALESLRILHSYAYSNDRLRTVNDETKHRMIAAVYSNGHMACLLIKKNCPDKRHFLWKLGHLIDQLKEYR